MHLWAHHLGCQTVDDKALRVAGTTQLDRYITVTGPLHNALNAHGRMTTTRDWSP